MRPMSRTLAFIAIATCVLAAGCSNDVTSPSTTPVVFSTTLSPANEVPPVGGPEGTGHGAVQIQFDVTRNAVRLHGGFEVKSAGDGFMIVFSQPRNGVECAVSIQRALAARIEDGGEPIRVRMGLHTGEAIRERDDFFGRNVVVAARIAAKARGGEVLVSAPLRDLADGAADVAFGEPRELGLKGLQGTYRVHSVEWDRAAAAARA